MFMDSSLGTENTHHTIVTPTEGLTEPRWAGHKDGVCVFVDFFYNGPVDIKSYFHVSIQR